MLVIKEPLNLFKIKKRKRRPTPMDSIKHTTIQYVSGTVNASSCNEGLYNR